MSSTNFYEVLSIDADASPKDIRRAYRKNALRTHPDRLPQGATAAEKEAANEQFRIVNNAYEILMDSKNRKLYDLYGVWPPPDELPKVPKKQRGDRSGHPSHRPPPDELPKVPKKQRGDRSGHPSHRPHPPSGVHDPVFNSSPFTHPSARDRPAAGFSFRDPFELFDAMFADMQRDFRHIPSRSVPNAPQSYSFTTSSGGQYSSGPNGQQPEWVSQSTMVKSINGVLYTIHERKDSLGNVHVTKIYPDGRQKYTVNGVEQPQSSGHIRGGRLPSANHDDDMAPPIIPPDPDEDAMDVDEPESPFVGASVHGISKKHRWGRH